MKSLPGPIIEFTQLSDDVLATVGRQLGDLDPAYAATAFRLHSVANGEAPRPADRTGGFQVVAGLEPCALRSQRRA